MKIRPWLFVPLALTVGCTDATQLTGTGASLPAPLYQKWFRDYNHLHPDVQVNYQSTGSGAGKKDLRAETVDFAASDAAMTPAEIEKVSRGVVCLPLTAGAIVLAFNIEGVDELKLSREAYTGIFTGKVTMWDDPLIQKTNAGVKLPAETIAVVVRADSSGTSYVFSKHLSEINEEFKKSPGVSTEPAWNCQCTKAAKNDGVTSQLNNTPNSIGYIEYSFLKIAKNLKQAALENKEGNFVTSSAATNQASLASMKMPVNLIAWNPDPAGKDAYPIVTYTWLLCYRKYDDREKMTTLQNLIRYCLTEGQKSSDKYGYIPLPEAVAAQVEKGLDQFQCDEPAVAKR
jgi:phosphate transport system substrate-binding protein